ncbi:hypothetical protein RB195_007146 [Necator americanus]|uniref:Uncharacterized protein n=2 Tax=Necator americanus TaxID=51031 RepID=W2SFQ3_NECAM|nr:hypothetical protein NECAME_15828 [Necator americanus]ETN68444.1 hypothetical protein NECAME_15828 [Necator americanus]
MSGKVSSASESSAISACPVCQAVPADKSDQFCRRCGCRLNLSCRYCSANIRPFDRYCASCGGRRLIIFDQLKQYLYIRSPFVIIGLSVALGGAWLALRYALREKLK